jgi:hypothetical protein
MQALDKSTVIIPDGWFDMTDMLPTKGRFYDGQKLVVKPYSYSEMEAINTQAEYSQAEAFNRAMTGMKFVTAIGSDDEPREVTSIYLGDVLFSLLYRKVITLGEQDFTLNDPIIGWTVEDISMEDIGVQDMLVPDLPATVTLPSSGKSVSFWPLTLEDVLGLLDADSEALPTLSTYIKIMTRGQLEASEVIGNADSELVEKIDSMFAHGFEPFTAKATDRDGKEVSMDINLNSSIFTLVLPFRPDGVVKELEITFGDPGKTNKPEGSS